MVAFSSLRFQTSSIAAPVRTMREDQLLHSASSTMSRPKCWWHGRGRKRRDCICPGDRAFFPWKATNLRLIIVSTRRKSRRSWTTCLFVLCPENKVDSTGFELLFDPLGRYVDAGLDCPASVCDRKVFLETWKRSELSWLWGQGSLIVRLRSMIF